MNFFRTKNRWIKNVAKKNEESNTQNTTGNLG